MRLIVWLYCLFSWALAVTLMTGSMGVAHAQSTEPPQPDDQNVVAFERLGVTDQTLSGVFDGDTLSVQHSRELATGIGGAGTTRSVSFLSGGQCTATVGGISGNALQSGVDRHG
jgi:hypothetical protein